MTKQQVINRLESKNVKVLFIQMHNGRPKATISWKDYLKVRGDPKMPSEYDISQK